MGSGQIISSIGCFCCVVQADITSTLILCLLNHVSGVDIRLRPNKYQPLPRDGVGATKGYRGQINRSNQPLLTKLSHSHFAMTARNASIASPSGILVKSSLDRIISATTKLQFKILEHESIFLTFVYMYYNTIFSEFRLG